MKVEIDYKFGQVLFLKNDFEQLEYLLTRIILLPKGNIVFELLSPSGEYLEAWEGLVSKERNILKMQGIEDKEDEEE